MEVVFETCCTHAHIVNRLCISGVCTCTCLFFGDKDSSATRHTIWHCGNACREPTVVFIHMLVFRIDSGRAGRGSRIGIGVSFGQQRSESGIAVPTLEGTGSGFERNNIILIGANRLCSVFRRDSTAQIFCIPGSDFFGGFIIGVILIRYAIYSVLRRIIGYIDFGVSSPSRSSRTHISFIFR